MTIIYSSVIFLLIRSCQSRRHQADRVWKPQCRLQIMTQLQCDEKVEEKTEGWLRRRKQALSHGIQLNKCTSAKP